MPLQNYEAFLEYKNKWRRDNLSKTRDQGKKHAKTFRDKHPNLIQKRKKDYYALEAAKRMGITPEAWIARREESRTLIAILKSAGIKNPRMRLRQLRAKKAIWAYKLSHPCPCGISDPVVLDFHHRDPNEKDGALSEAENWSERKLRLEMAKCDVLCKLCHTRLHWKERQCEITEAEKYVFESIIPFALMMGAKVSQQGIPKV